MACLNCQALFSVNCKVAKLCREEEANVKSVSCRFQSILRRQALLQHCAAGARGLSWLPAHFVQRLQHTVQNSLQTLLHTVALSAVVHFSAETVAAIYLQRFHWAAGCYWESSEHEQLSVALFKSVSLSSWLV